MPRSLAWALLLPLPLLSLAYLAAVRSELVAPHWFPVLALAPFPLAALVLGARRSVAGPRRLAVTLIALAELAWILLALALVGFAIAWRSG